MMETNWGSPLAFVVSKSGDTIKFTTLEQARYWLLKKWPVAEHNRDRALEQLDAAMHCMTTIGAARKAFISAAQTAGIEPHRAVADDLAAI